MNSTEPAANSGTSPLVDNFATDQMTEEEGLSAESLYNRVPRNLANSQARSIERGDFVRYPEPCECCSPPSVRCSWQK